MRASVEPNHARADAQLVASREVLCGHHEALHEPREPWGVTVYDLQAELVGLDDAAANDVRFRGDALMSLDADTASNLEGMLERFAALGGTTLPSSSKPWASAEIETDDAAIHARDLVQNLRVRLLPAARAALMECCRDSGLPEAATIGAWDAHLTEWEQAAEQASRVRPEIYAADLQALARDLHPARAGGLSKVMAGLMSGTYKRARAEARGLMVDPTGDAALLEAIEDASERLAKWKALGGTLPPTAPASLEAARAAHQALVAGLDELGAILRRDDLAGMSADQIAALVDKLDRDQHTLSALPEIHELRSALAAAGLAELMELLVGRRADAAQCTAAFRYSRLTSILEHVRFSDRRIGVFSPGEIDRARSQFQAAERTHIATSAARVRRAYAEAVTAARDENGTEATLLQREAGKKRGHLPLRTLVERSPTVLRALKPCWAMSPLLVSQVLPAGTRFDVVVFDEASQVTPADAMPSIMRGQQVVVAGDERQLPPTAFFAAPPTDDDTYEGPDAVDALHGFESILDVLATMVPFRMLAWHYRSRDERLIAFSNAHVYERALTTFPGTNTEVPVHHVLVPQTANTATEDSSSYEVRRVVELVIEHAETRAEESLGVVALGITHAQRIEQALREALEWRRDLDEFFDEEREERFFVKNLERVQGDEREAIILSIGFAKGANGKLSHNFGPINRDGGERRLNVAVTRARRRMTVISSFAATDIDPNRSSARGVALLRQYLQYAESGGAYLGDHAPSHPALNPFEIDVRDTLAARGIPLTPQLGVSGYYIDFAAGHPDRPGDYVLAIECDGASYHSAPTARDRDRLRQQQLECLGWRFHRIWSTDWFNDRDGAADRACAAWREAVAAREQEAHRDSSVFQRGSDTGTEPAKVTSQGTVGLRAAPELAADQFPTVAPQPREGYCPVSAGRPISGYTQSELRQVVRWVRSDTRLRTRDELLEEVMAALGFKRRGKLIVAAISDAIEAELR